DDSNELLVIDALKTLLAEFRPDIWPGDGSPVQPLVVNISLDHNRGGHDGTSPLERAIEGALKKSVELASGRKPLPALAVALAAGNDGGRRRHALGAVAPKMPRILSWQFLPLGDEPAMLNRMTLLSKKSLALKLVPPDRGQPIVLDITKDKGTIEYGGKT